MDKLYRSLSRVALIFTMPIAQEKFSLSTHLNDFVYYYFTRFLTNITDVFKNFSTSYIKDYNQRHKEKMAILVSHPNVEIKDSIVPIPLGMVHSYAVTTLSLNKVLESVAPQTIVKDLQALLAAMGDKRIEPVALTPYSKDQFEDAKNTVIKLFGKTGLTHATAKYALESKSKVKTVNDLLIKITTDYYPLVIAINPLLKKIEDKHTNASWSSEDKIMLSKQLMEMAYRLSIFAVVMDHIQQVEFSFTQNLDILLNQLHQ